MLLKGLCRVNIHLYEHQLLFFRSGKVLDESLALNWFSSCIWNKQGEYQQNTLKWKWDICVYI